MGREDRVVRWVGKEDREVREIREDKEVREHKEEGINVE